MCAFTTKTAVYTLARAFAGFDILIVLGVVMAIYGIIYAIMENDIRKLLAWEIVSQVGYMVAGVGIGTPWRSTAPAPMPLPISSTRDCCSWAAGAIMYMHRQSQVHRTGRPLQKDAADPDLFMVVGGLSVSSLPFLSRLCQQIDDYQRQLRVAPALGRLPADCSSQPAPSSSPD